MTSGAWARATPRFLDVIQLLPGMDAEDYQFDLINQLGDADSDDEHSCRVQSRGLHDGICDACRRTNNPASMKATFFGRPYDLPWMARSWYGTASSPHVQDERGKWLEIAITVELNNWSIWLLVFYLWHFQPGASAYCNFFARSSMCGANASSIWICQVWMLPSALLQQDYS